MVDESNHRQRFGARRLRRRRVLRGVALGGAGLAAVAVIGCAREERPSPAPAVAQPVRGGTITISHTSTEALPHMDPHQNSFSVLHDTGPAIIYSRLLRRDMTKYPNELEYTGDLAASFENPEPQTYVFKLRPGVKWQNIPPVNGRELVAEDILFSYRRQIAERVNADVLAAVDKLEAIDSTIVRFTLKRPDADFLWAVGDTRSKIVAREAVEVRGDVKEGPAIGTGPWIFEQWLPEQVLRLRRNPDYFLQGLPYADAFERRIIPDPQTRQAAFRTGQLLEIDTNGQITKLLRQSVPDLYVQDQKLMEVISFIPLIASPAHGPTRDLRVRQALSKILDREAIIRDVLFGSGWLNAAVFVPSFDWHLPEAEIKRLLARDLQGARQLLSAAGVDPASWRPVISSGIPGQHTVPAAEAFVAQLKEVGISASVRVIDKTEITEKVFIRGEEALYLGSHRPSAGGTNGHLKLFFHSTGSDAVYFKQLGDKRLDDLIDKQAVMVSEREQRKAVLQEIMRLNIELAVVIPVYTTTGEMALSPRLQGYKRLSNEPHIYAEAWVKG